MDIREKIKKLPDSPGVYLMKDAAGAVIYIGKAASLRKRAAGYFGKKSSGFKADTMLSSVKDIAFITTPRQEEALLLEAALIRQRQPKYNVLLKDDKRYPLLKLTIKEKFPRLLIARRKKNDGALYYGPFTNASLLRQALKFMQGVFPLRTCRSMPKRACLSFHIARCPAPCEGKIKQAKYKKIADDVRLFLEGEKSRLVESLTERMRNAADSKDFEEAARLRDQIRALTSVGAERLSALGLKAPPARIDAFDISNIFGREAVGSMVSFHNGRPDKSNYKRFRIKGVPGIDDYKMIREVIRRRYEKVKQKGPYIPGLIIVDGGRGHVRSAQDVLNDLGLGYIKVIGISKKEELLHLPERKTPLKFSASSPELQLIQRARDEAHRFAQNYHHTLREKTISRSIVDGIPGIGPKRKGYLLKNFTLFELRVYLAVGSIPRGQTRSYKWAAQQAGRPKAVRAAANALKKNPFLGIIPCHRVIASDGTIGGFSRGIEKKRQMLKKEGVDI